MNKKKKKNGKIDIMTKAFVLLNSETGQENSNLEIIKKLTSVKEAFRIFGVYDIIILVEEDDMKQLKETIFHKIRMIDGVRATLTLLVL